MDGTILRASVAVCKAQFGLVNMMWCWDVGRMVGLGQREQDIIFIPCTYTSHVMLVGIKADLNDRSRACR